VWSSRLRIEHRARESRPLDARVADIDEENQRAALKLTSPETKRRNWPFTSTSSVPSSSTPQASPTVVSAPLMTRTFASASVSRPRHSSANGSKPPPANVTAPRRTWWRR